MTTIVDQTDIIDTILGADRADVLADVRDARPDARRNAQRAFDALFSPTDDTEFSLSERQTIAAFAVGLHDESLLWPFYALRLTEQSGQPAALTAELTRGAGNGPFGRYREAGLADESTDGGRYRVADEHTSVFGPRLVAALEHTHLLVFRPREASPDALDALLDAGWSVTGIVTLSQLVAYLTFQIRVVHGLAELAADIVRTDTDITDTDTDEDSDR
jgi:CMD domain protein